MEWFAAAGRDSGGRRPATGAHNQSLVSRKNIRYDPNHMAFTPRRYPSTGNHDGPGEEYSESELPQMGNTGAEAEFLKTLVDTRARVTVVLRTGERLSGRIRYYDRDCFSIGPADGGPKILVRKSSVRYIEEQEAWSQKLEEEQEARSKKQEP
jgi:sRNA-binding regulator protein Hfq